jgi:diguanylate cyclase (GGDEF)-like protein
MSLDLPTLFIVCTCVTALLGLLMFFAWIQDRSIHALAWWGSAYLIGGLAVSLWSIRDLISPFPVEVATALLFAACGMVWNGARLFQGRPVLRGEIFIGALVWIIACQFPFFSESSSGRIVLSSVIVSTYTYLLAHELWRERRAALFSRLPATLVPLLHGTVFLAPIVMTTLPSHDGTPTLSGGWLAVFTLETLLYIVGTAFIGLVMAKEKAESVHKTAAVTDPLTGLVNRRGFFDRAQWLIVQQAIKGQAVTVLMFDLDFFKSVNDRFGHAIGDETLCAFANTALNTLRGTDIVGRLGGEEFAAILPSALPEGLIAAERVRAAFEAAGREIAGRQMNVTVSIGAASAEAARCEIHTLLGAADQALYRAKKNGRNQVEGVEIELPALKSGTPAAAPAMLPAGGAIAAIAAASGDPAMKEFVGVPQRRALDHAA